MSSSTNYITVGIIRHYKSFIQKPALFTIFIKAFVMYWAQGRKQIWCNSTLRGQFSLTRNFSPQLYYMTKFHSNQIKKIYIDKFSLTWVLEAGMVAALTQYGLPFSFFCTIYSVIGEPPSFLGLTQAISAWSSSQSITTGFSGASGSSEKNKNKN